MAICVRMAIGVCVAVLLRRHLAVLAAVPAAGGDILLQHVPDTPQLPSHGPRATIWPHTKPGMAHASPDGCAQRTMQACFNLT